MKILKLVKDIVLKHSETKSNWLKLEWMGLISATGEEVMFCPPPLTALLQVQRTIFWDLFKLDSMIAKCILCPFLLYRSLSVSVAPKWSLWCKTLLLLVRTGQLDARGHCFGSHFRWLVISLQSRLVKLPNCDSAWEKAGLLWFDLSNDREIIAFNIHSPLSTAKVICGRLVSWQ